jgi:tetratricopeptide (TPR) repeat protein
LTCTTTILLTSTHEFAGTQRQRTSEQAESLIDNGRYAIVCGDYERAIQYFREATHVDEKNKVYRLALAEALMHDEKYFESQIQMERCLELHPFWIPARQLWLNAEEMNGKAVTQGRAKTIQQYDDEEKEWH